MRAELAPRYFQAGLLQLLVAAIAVNCEGGTSTHVNIFLTIKVEPNVISTEKWFSHPSLNLMSFFCDPSAIVTLL